MSAPDHLEQVEICAPGDLRAWLERNHAQPDSVWLVTYKKHVADKYVSTGQVLDELIAFGWIDGRRLKLDDDRTMQLIAPRRMQAWSQSYKDRAERLIAEGRMAAPGVAAMEAGKASGLWEFYADIDALVVPGDLARALSASPPAEGHFAAFAPSSRRNILRWIKLARTEATRAKRIAKVAALAAQNLKPPQM